MTSVCSDLVVDPGAGSERILPDNSFAPGCWLKSCRVSKSQVIRGMRREMRVKRRREEAGPDILSSPLPLSPPGNPLFLSAILSCLACNGPANPSYWFVRSRRCGQEPGAKRGSNHHDVSHHYLRDISAPVSLSSCALQLRSLGRVTQRGNPRDTKKRILNGRNAGGGNAVPPIKLDLEERRGSRKKLKRDRAWKEGSKSLTCNAWTVVRAFSRLPCSAPLCSTCLLALRLRVRLLGCPSSYGGNTMKMRGSDQRWYSCQNGIPCLS